MTVNWPTLPLFNAMECVPATLLGLALALAPGAWAARRHMALAWLTMDGFGLMPVLLLLWAIELPGRGLISAPVAYGVAGEFLCFQRGRSTVGLLCGSRAGCRDYTDARGISAARRFLPLTWRA